MALNYYSWSTDRNIDLVLQLVTTAGAGATGKTPEVSIRRHRLQDGTPLDDYFWNGSAFQAGPYWHTLSEFDAVNNPGMYNYYFEQGLIATEQSYLVYFRHTVDPIGYAVEEHKFTGEIYIPVIAGVVPVAPGETVMGKLQAMEDPLQPVALANADAVWDEVLNQHLIPGSTGEALSKFTVTLTGSRQIDITVEDGASVPISGAQIDIRRTDNSFLGRVFTDINGEVSINLDDGTYLLFIFASGYTFTVPETLIISGNAAVTYTGSSLIVITPPTSPDLCVIFGTVRDAAGAVVAGACVEAFAVTPQVVAGVQKGARVAQAITDSNGQFQIELVRLTTVRFAIAGTDVDFERVVPDAASQDLTTWT